MILVESVGVALTLLVEVVRILSDLAVVDVRNTTARVSGLADGVDDILVILLVLVISGSVRRQRLSGFYPRLLMAYIFVLFCPKGFGHMILTKGNVSYFSMSEPNPIRILNKTNLLFSLTIQLSNIHTILLNRPLSICGFH